MWPIFGLAVGAFAIVATLVTHSILQSRWLKGERDDAKENWKSHDLVVKSNFDLQLQVRVLTQEVNDKNNALVSQGRQLERETDARVFLEEKLRKFVLSMGEKGDVNVLAKSLEGDLQRLNQLRSPFPLPPASPVTPAPPKGRQTPAETPTSKATVPIDPTTLKGKIT